MVDDYDMEDVSVENQTPCDKAAVAQCKVAPPSPGEIVKNGNSTLIVTIFDDETTTLENIHTFLTRWPPSITPVSYCSWIALDRGGHHRPAPNLSGLFASFEALKVSESVTAEEIDRIARENDVLSGKWLVYADPPQVDALWTHIVGMVCLGLKRGSIKVSPRQEGESHVICVYADDYTDEVEVSVIREALRAAGVTWRIGFKPDAYTHLGIYKKNAWSIRPSRYFS